MVGIPSSAKVKEFGAELRDACALRGMFFTVAESEQLIVDRIRRMAERLGVTERTIMTSYLDDQVIEDLADALTRDGTVQEEAMSAAPPKIMTIQDAGCVAAALGMTMKLAVEALDVSSARTESLGVATDCADAVVGLGVALSKADGDDRVEVDGRTTVYARRVLLGAVRLLRAEKWAYACRSLHAADECRLQKELLKDLHRMGDWESPEQEPPASQR